MKSVDITLRDRRSVRLRALREADEAAECGGAGMAKRMMTAIIDEARRRGRKQMEGFVLAGNPSMLRLARRLGFQIVSDADDPTIRICRLNLDPPWPAAATVGA